MIAEAKLVEAEDVEKAEEAEAEAEEAGYDEETEGDVDLQVPEMPALPDPPDSPQALLQTPSRTGPLSQDILTAVATLEEAQAPGEP